MAKKSRRRLRALVAGADSGFGRELYNSFLHNAGVALYSIQKGPPTLITDASVDNWSVADFSFPDEVVRGIRPFVEEFIEESVEGSLFFDAVFVCVEQDWSVPFDLCTSVNIDNAISSNVSVPIALCRYLIEFGVATEATWFVFIVRNAEGCGPDAFPLRVSRLIFPVAVRALFSLGEFSVFKTTLVTIQDGIDSDHDMVMSQLVRILTEAGDRPNIIRG